MKNIEQIILYAFLLLALPLILSPDVNGQQAEENQSLGTIEELRKAILQVLQETGTPAAGIALVDSTGSIWIEGLGKADIENGIEADAETMFRIASTSKVFVALAILKLQEEGKLSLKDSVRDLIPEIEFANSWEGTNPILLEHLLEHTTGWDDIHPVEFTHNNPVPISLKEGLDLHPHSRTSRWVPGTRMAYANSGPAVAAYVIEKVSGQNFENYIQENFFNPMGMETTTYFLSEDYKRKGATLYEDGQRVEYRHFIFRPSGAINASPKDMAKLVQLFINRGKIDSIELISERSLKRMETPSTTSGAQEGLKFGYGLCIYTSEHNGFTYYKHGGSVHGGLSDLSYLPEYGVGYSLQINAKNRDALYRISRLIRNFQTQNLPQPDREIPWSNFVVSQDVEGYYQIINPRNSLPFNLPPLLAERVWIRGDTLYNQIPAHLGNIEKFIPAGGNVYQSVRLKRPDLVFVNDPLEGEVIEVAGLENGTITLGPVSGILFFGRILVLILWMTLLIHAFLLFPFWGFRYWKGKIPGGANVQVRLWPVLAGFFLLLSVFFMAIGAMGDFEALARPGLVSISIMIGTIAFFVAAVYSLIAVIRYRNNGVKSSVYIPAAILSVLHTLVAFYLLWHGVIGGRTWV